MGSTSSDALTPTWLAGRGAATISRMPRVSWLLGRGALVLVLLVLPVALLAQSAHATGCRDSLPNDPCLTLTPDRGPIGTRVEISGRVHSHISLWRGEFQNSAFFALIRDFPHGWPGGPSECELLVGADRETAHVSVNGRVSGSFTVASSGSCFQHQSEISYPTQKGRYGLSIGCHACEVAEFTVTDSALPFSGGASIVLQTMVAAFALVSGIALLMLGRR